MKGNTPKSEGLMYIDYNLRHQVSRDYIGKALPKSLQGVFVAG
jgi:hypothetical protein